MGFKNKIANKILSKSGSYRFYKEQYEKNVAKNKINSNKDLLKQFNDLKNDFEVFKRTTNDQLVSSNFLFKTLFIDHEINQPKSILNYIQSLSSELLFFVSNICKNNDIDWWLDYGTLIGAVRHENFVPWDDDMDIGMIREDYLKFDNIILNELENYDLDGIVRVEYKPCDINNGSIGSFIQLFVKDKTWNSGNRETILGGVDVFP